MGDLFEDLRFEKAGILLDELNSDLKPKEQYKPIGYFEEKGFLILVASSSDRKLMMNAVDFEGNLPNGFCANWRVPQLILHDLQIEKFT